MEPSLNLPYAKLMAEVGEFLGYGRGAAFGDPAWDSRQQTDIDFCVQSGLRQFYYPVSVDGQPGSYTWSFLRPTFTITLAAGAQTVALPDDFGGFEGQISILTTGTTAMPWSIRWLNESRIRDMYQQTPTMTGPPMYAVTEPLKGTAGDRGQRWQLLVFPLADQTYTLTGTYSINPDALDGALPYAYGGAEHAETVLESCLAIAEQRRDDAMSVHTMKYKERLQASISMDRNKKPDNLGYNADRSDGYEWNRRSIHGFEAAATYNGQAFS